MPLTCTAWHYLTQWGDHRIPLLLVAMQGLSMLLRRYTAVEHILASLALSWLAQSCQLALFLVTSCAARWALAWCIRISMGRKQHASYP